jgi:hypothetical protein
MNFFTLVYNILFYFRHSPANSEEFIRIYRPNYFIQNIKINGVWFKYKIVNNRKILCEQKHVKISKATVKVKLQLQIEDDSEDEIMEEVD